MQISTKFAQNKILGTIQHAFMLLMPITMIGGFAALFKGISIVSYQNFIMTVGIYDILNNIYQWTIGMLGLYLSFLVAYAYANRKGTFKSEIAIGLTSLVCFLILTPYTLPDTPYGSANLPTNWLGSSGMFSAIITGFIVGGIFNLCQKYHLEIKLPEQVPPFVAAQFSSLIPVVISALFFGLVNLIFIRTPFGCFHQLVYSILSKPLQVSNNVFGGWILMICLYGLWFLGIHGGMTVGPVIMILFMQFQMENLAAYQAGLPIPHIYVGDALSYGTGSLPLLVAIMIFAKSKQNRSIGKLAIIPSFFGIDEPAYFGLPMILNPIFFIPWVIISPTVSIFGTYILKLIGLLPYANGTGGNAANLPFFVGNLMQYGIWGLIWGIVFFVIIVICYIPFVKAYDKQKLAEEVNTQVEE